MPTLDTVHTFNPLRECHKRDVIGIIETRRDSKGSYDGGIVAYRERGVEGDHCYVVHHYSILPDGSVSLSNGLYRLTRSEAMGAFLDRVHTQGMGAYNPTLG